MRIFSKDTRFPHYHGHVVRSLFVTGATIMLVTIPVFKHLLPIGTFVSILLMLLVGFSAGLTNPFQRWVMILDMLIALAAFVTFEYHAIAGYRTVDDPLFWINQTLAAIFFFAFYFATKTARAVFVQPKSPPS